MSTESMGSAPCSACSLSSYESVVVDNSLYALGGADTTSFIDTVQRLSSDSLWQLMQLDFPKHAVLSPALRETLK
jgi:hypothetical protein